MKTDNLIEILGSLIKLKADGVDCQPDIKLLTDLKTNLVFLNQRNDLLEDALEEIAELDDLEDALDVAEKLLNDTSVVHCSTCNGPFSLDTEGGMQTYFQNLPVAFCPSCLENIRDIDHE